MKKQILIRKADLEQVFLNKKKIYILPIAKNLMIPKNFLLLFQLRLLNPKVTLIQNVVFIYIYKYICTYIFLYQVSYLSFDFDQNIYLFMTYVWGIDFFLYF